jgi:hypothetical protein
MILPPIGLGPSTSTYTEHEAVEAWPSPEMINTPIGPPYLGKTAVAGLVRDAVTAGWTVHVTHARGCYPSIGQKPSKQKDSLAVRMRRRDQRAVAVYVEASTWSWDILYRWVLGEFPAKLPTITAFRAVL